VRVFFDTSVLVATFLGDHVHHGASLTRFAQAEKAEAGCAPHSLAETYAVLTRLPVRPPIGPHQALVFIRQICERLTVVPLDERQYAATLEDAALRGITGGRTYDALCIHCADVFQSDVIYTWNTSHFRAIAPSWGEQIRTPE
jgi:predicted nucleic acid-binding protein